MAADSSEKFASVRLHGVTFRNIYCHMSFKS
jgi:hypothetical protein